MTRPLIPIAALTPTADGSLPDEEVDAAIGKLVDEAFAAAHQQPADALAFLLAAISEFADRTDSPGEVLVMAIYTLDRIRRNVFGIPDEVVGD